MSPTNLSDVAEALCKSVASGDVDSARRMAFMLAARMGGARADRIKRALAASSEHASPAALPTAKRIATPVKKSAHWDVVIEKRSPWVPADIADEIAAWVAEAKHGDALSEAGERVLPLLLCGETRCGKTSSLCVVANTLGLTVRRLSLGAVIGSLMGECARLIRAALQEAAGGDSALWLIDEIDGITMKRNGGQAAADERANAIGVLLAELEALPPGLMLCATTNTMDLMDAAVVARFRAVRFPTWADLDGAGRKAFAVSHGLRGVDPGAESYADVVHAARAARVQKIIARATGGDQPAIPGVA